MNWKEIFWSFIALFLIALLIFYWFFPLGPINFGITSNSGNYNFSLNNSINTSMQFYPNMRYPASDISYDILNCSLQRTEDMKTAFNIIENGTNLTFYPVNQNEEISVACADTPRLEGGNTFVAGEGGPTNITESGNFNVISHGTVLLLRDSDCPRPNIETHELLHALGFVHSPNSNNIMYPISNCDQTLGQDTLDLINQLYSFPSLPDLYFENVSATMSGRYLNLNLTVRNGGLANAPPSIIDIYADGNLIHEINVDSLGIGNGREVLVNNLFVLQRSISELNFSIKTDFDELQKQNNEAVLKI